MQQIQILIPESRWSLQLLWHCQEYVHLTHGHILLFLITKTLKNCIHAETNKSTTRSYANQKEPWRDWVCGFLLIIFILQVLYKGFFLNVNFTTAICLHCIHVLLHYILSLTLMLHLTSVYPLFSYISFCLRNKEWTAISSQDLGNSSRLSYFL